MVGLFYKKKKFHRREDTFFKTNLLALGLKEKAGNFSLSGIHVHVKGVISERINKGCDFLCDQTPIK